MKLTEAREGAVVMIKSIAGDDMTLQAMRFGIDSGAQVRIHKKIGGGPIIVGKNHLEIAIGREMACAIEITPVETDDVT